MISIACYLNWEDKVPVFKYSAQTIKGRKFGGQIEAVDVNDAKAQLRKKQLVPLKIVLIGDKVSIIKKVKPPGFFESLGAPKVKSKDLQIFTRQFSTLINAGIPVVEALGVLTQGSTQNDLRGMLIKAKTSIEGGKSLGDALAQHPGAFDNFFCNMVRAGEASGALDIILGRMSTYLEKTEKMKNQIKSAMMYPVMILAVASIVIVLILIYIIPKFQEMYKSSGGDLPWLTQQVVNLSEWLQKDWWMVLGGVIGLYFGAKSYYETPAGKIAVDEILMKMPLFGDVFTKSGVARFSRTMSTLLSSGVPLLEAIEVGARTVGNSVIENNLLKCRESVAIGKGFSGPLNKIAIFPKMVAQMIEIGEQTGSLDSMLGKIADFYEDEVDNAVKGMMTLIEPLLLVFIGGIIAVLVLAMYLPIFGMADAATKGT
jgi:type IV pilus assembly protein PilC